jgi:hypothetical protein
MSGDDAEFEYPDEAGYPDGMGTLHEGIDEPGGADAGPGDDAGARDAGDALERELDDFAMQDEADVDGD